jgi:pimeloyl-ACP methyl ester carboxylesterase
LKKDADNHYPPITLDGNWFGRQTRAHWSREPAKRLVLFVHGFGGDPIGTWTDFPVVLRSIPKLADCDFIFFGYDGLTTQANTSATILDDFLTRYLLDPAAVINARQPVKHGRKTFAYERIVIAAHSLGAVVARRALLQAEQEREVDDQANGWLTTIRLVLFAPAHRGAYAAEIANNYLMTQDWWVSKIVAAIGQLYVPLLSDLDPKSELIAELLTDTQVAARTAATEGHLIARRVLWAQDEKIVRNGRFYLDTKARVQYGADHFSVCKPDSSVHAAAQAILEQL